AVTANGANEYSIAENPCSAANLTASSSPVPNLVASKQNCIASQGHNQQWESLLKYIKAKRSVGGHESYRRGMPAPCHRKNPSHILIVPAHLRIGYVVEVHTFHGAHLKVLIAPD